MSTNSTVTFNASVEVMHVSGPVQDAETLLDAFAGTIGRQNGAKKPLVLECGEYERESVYEVRLIDEC